MTALKDIILIGGGGHCRSVIDVIEQEGRFSIAGILDTPENLGKEIGNYQVTGTDEDLPARIQPGRFFLITLGHIKSNAPRKRAYAQLKSLGAELPVVVSPLAYVSPHSRIGEGTVVHHRAVVNAGVTVGLNSILNTGCILEHDVQAGDHCHISTSAVVNGDCRIGDDCFIGSNAVLRQGLRIGNRVTVGSGSVVTKAIEDNQLVYGNPAGIKNR